MRVKGMRRTMWLCPIKQKSWKIIKKKKVYGLPCGRRKELDALEIGDRLAIYVYPPIHGIVSVCKVISHTFIDDEPLWGENLGQAKYRCRIKVEPIPKYTVRNNETVPLYKVLGFENRKKRYIVEPFLHNVLFVQLSKTQSKVLLNELAR